MTQSHTHMEDVVYTVESIISTPPIENTEPHGKYSASYNFSIKAFNVGSSHGEL